MMSIRRTCALCLIGVLAAAPAGAQESPTVIKAARLFVGDGQLPPHCTPSQHIIFIKCKGHIHSASTSALHPLISMHISSSPVSSSSCNSAISYTT